MLWQLRGAHSELGQKSVCEQTHASQLAPDSNSNKMDIYDTSIMDPDPPRPDESSPQRPEDDAPPPPADGEDVSPTLGALKTVGGAAARRDWAL